MSKSIRKLKIEIKKKSTVRCRKIEHVVRGKFEVNFGHFELSIEDGCWIHLFFRPSISCAGHIYPPSPDKEEWRKESISVFRSTINMLKAFDKEQAIADLEEAITRINELI